MLDARSLDQTLFHSTKNNSNVWQHEHATAYLVHIKNVLQTDSDSWQDWLDPSHREECAGLADGCVHHPRCDLLPLRRPHFAKVTPDSKSHNTGQRKARA